MLTKKITIKPTNTGRLQHRHHLEFHIVTMPTLRARIRCQRRNENEVLCRIYDSYFQQTKYGERTLQLHCTSIQTNVLLPDEDMDRIYLWGIHFHTFNTRELIVISFKEIRHIG